MQETEKKYFAAADIGTTSVCAAVSDRNGRELFRKTFYNPGRKFGADVISRITYTGRHPESVEEIGRLMRESVGRALLEGCGECGIRAGEIGFLAAVGNPAMELLFNGMNPEPLGVYPYALPDDFGRVTGSICGIPVHSGKLLSGYIGADALTGAAYLLYGRKEERPLVCADLGTNCECFRHDGKKTEFVSSAAGPAFEGGNIECGMGAVPGAVTGICDGPEGTAFSVVGGEKPKGFCGSGIISAAAYMLEKGIIDRSGRMNPEAPGVYTGADGLRFGFGGAVYISQNDVRQIQTAKAAVAAGIALLSGQSGISESDIVLTGAFGDSIDRTAAEKIGLIPHGKTFSTVGNAALEGALLYARDEKFRLFADGLARSSRCRDMSLDSSFPELFINNVNFY